MACGALNPAADISWVNPVALTVNVDNTLTKTGPNNAPDASASGAVLYDPNLCSYAEWQITGPTFGGVWSIVFEDEGSDNQYGWEFSLFFSSYIAKEIRDGVLDPDTTFFSYTVNSLDSWFRIAIEEGDALLQQSDDGGSTWNTFATYPVPTDRNYRITARITSPGQSVPEVEVYDTSVGPTFTGFIMPFTSFSAELETDSPHVTGTHVLAGEYGGSPVPWFIVPPVSDSGEELRAKVVKAVRTIGKLTAAQIMVYGYDLTEPIVVADLEEGSNSSTGAISLTNTTDVTETPREPVDVVNAVLHTVRLSGVWSGVGEPDTVHEIVYEVAVQGARR